MAISSPAASGSAASSRARTFGPLIGVVVAAVLALVVLPSNFTLPNSNPSPQVAIAPVPPSNNKVTPPQSNFTALNTASQGNGLGGAGAGGGRGFAAPPPLAGGVFGGKGILPAATKECVNGRQTEDTMSPPCVAYYQGNNGGATFQGVTGNVVRILVYHDCYQSTGGYATPCGAIENMDNPPNPQKISPPEQALVAWQKFFNFRFQTYNRHVQFWGQWATYDDAGSGLEDSTSQQEDAANAYAKVHPFAVIDMSTAFGGGGTGYVSYMNQHHVLVFGTAVGLSESFYHGYPGLDYGYAMPTERSASQYADFICGTLAGHPTDDTGATTNAPGEPPVQNGEKRVYGYIYPGDPAVPSLKVEGDEAMADIKHECGITPKVTVSYPSNGYVVDTSQTPQYAISDVQKLRAAGVTTLLWPAGFETKISQAAHQANYFPEWIMGDDNIQPANGTAQFQDQSEWAHAWDITSITYTPQLQQQICYVEYRQVDQSMSDGDMASEACPLYPPLRQLFIGIQVAGPSLTPTSIDQGFHAIPAKASTNPQIPACFYLPNDYTCVKDTAIEHYDPNVPASQTDDNEPGAWRMSNAGKRYLPGQFPKESLVQLKGANDVINEFDETSNICDCTPSTP